MKPHREAGLVAAQLAGMARGGPGWRTLWRLGLGAAREAHGAAGADAGGELRGRQEAALAAP